MKKLLQFMLLSFSILFIRYLFSVIVVYLFPVYVFTNDARIINDSPQVVGDLPVTDMGSFWNKHQAKYNVNVAVNGYVDGDPVYPGYPLFLRLLLKLFPVFSNINHVYVLASVISTIFFGYALYYLDKLLEQLFLFDDKKYLVMLFLIVFPGSIFFHLPYSESLFLFLTVFAFHLLFIKNYNSAFLLVVFAVSTKLVGILLLVPFIYYFYVCERFNKKIKVAPTATFYVAMTLLPLLIYYFTLYENTRNVLSVFTTHVGSWKFMYLPFAYFFDYFQQFCFTINPAYIMNFVFMVALLIFVIYTSVKLFLLFEFRSLEQTTMFIYFILYFFLLSAFSGGSNIFRYAALCLPMFLFPAIATNMYVRSNKYLAFAFTLLIIQTLFFVIYVTGIFAYVN